MLPVIIQKGGETFGFVNPGRFIFRIFHDGAAGGALPISPRAGSAAGRTDEFIWPKKMTALCPTCFFHREPPVINDFCERKGHSEPVALTIIPQSPPGYNPWRRNNSEFVCRCRFEATKIDSQKLTYRAICGTIKQLYLIAGTGKVWKELMGHEIHS